MTMIAQSHGGPFLSHVYIISWHKSGMNKMSCIYFDIYIFIYICVCVCVLYSCLDFETVKKKHQSQLHVLLTCLTTTLYL